MRDLCEICEKFKVVDNEYHLCLDCLIKLTSEEEIDYDYAYHTQFI